MKYLILLLIFATSCTIEQQDLSEYRFPTELSEIPTDPNNPITQIKVDVGDTLFNSAALSLTGMVSCSSCHFGEHGESPDPKFPGGIGEGADLKLTDEGMRYVMWEGYEANVDSMTWVKSRSFVNSCFQEISGLSGRFGGTDNPQLRKDKIAHFGIKLSEPMINKLMGCHATLFQAVVALDGHNQFSVKRIIKNEYFKNQLYLATGLKITGDTPEEEIVFAIACCLDAFQRVEGIRNQSRFQQAARGEISLTTAETAGFILFKSNCATAKVNGIEYGCHTAKDLSGGIVPSFFEDREGVPDCANNITGDPSWIKDTTQIYRKASTIAPGSVAYGPHAEYRKRENYVDFKLQKLNIELSYNERSWLKSYLDAL